MPSTMLGLLTLFVMIEPSSGPETSPVRELRALQSDYDAACRDYRQASGRAMSVEDQKALSAQFRQIGHAFASRAFRLARANNRDLVAIDALVWVAQEIRPEAGTALEILVRDHLASEKLLDACRVAATAPLCEFEAAETLLRRAMEESPHRKVRGIACLLLAERLKERAEIVLDLDLHFEDPKRLEETYGFSAKSMARFRANGSSPLAKEAGSLYELTVTQYGDINSRRGVTFGDLARGKLFALRHLSLGMKAPDITGRDIDGREFKLSEYRGRVVILTFSGTWCGACRRLYPLERQLAERFKDRPLAVVSVDTDDEATLRKAIATGEITWRCWCDGRPDGPITLQWGIDTFPTVFVLDREGMIHYKAVHGAQLEKVVAALLETDLQNTQAEQGQ
jgi:peroxiredoxin